MEGLVGALRAAAMCVAMDDACEQQEISSEACYLCPPVRKSHNLCLSKTFLTFDQKKYLLYMPITSTLVLGNTSSSVGFCSASIGKGYVWHAQVYYIVYGTAGVDGVDVSFLLSRGVRSAPTSSTLFLVVHDQSCVRPQFLSCGFLLCDIGDGARDTRHASFVHCCHIPL